MIVNAPWPGFVAQRNFARATRRGTTGCWRSTPTSASRPRCARRSRRCARSGFHARRLPHPARGLLPGPLDPRHRLVPRSAAAALRPHARGRWQGDLVHESVRVRGPVGPPARRARAPPLRATSADHLRTIDRYTTLWARAGLRGRARRRASCDVSLARGLGLLPQLRPEARLPARQRGPDRLGAERVLHVRRSWPSSRELARSARRAAMRGACHVDTAADLARRPEPGAADGAGHGRARARGRARLPRGRRARGARARRRPRRARRCPSAATCGRRGVLALARLLRAGCRPRRACSSTIRTRCPRASLAARPAAPAPLVATRRVDFPLQRPALAVRSTGPAARVIAVSRRDRATVLEADGRRPRARCASSTRACPTGRPQPGGRDALRGAGRARRRARRRQRGRAHRPQGPRDAARGGARCVRARVPEARLRDRGRGRAARRARGAGARARPRRPRASSPASAPTSTGCSPPSTSSACRRTWRGSAPACSTRWPSRGRWWPPPPAASRRRWRTASPAGVVPPRDPRALADALVESLGDAARARGHGRRGPPALRRALHRRADGGRDARASTRRPREGRAPS